MDSIRITTAPAGASAVPLAAAGTGAGRRTATERAGATLGADAIDRVSLPQAAGPMAQRDLRNISFGDMARLGHDLVAAGILPADKLLDFIPLRSNFKIAADGSPSFAPDTPTDMIRRQQDIIASQKAAGLDQRFIDHSTSVLNLYQNIQALHEQALA